MMARVLGIVGASGAGKTTLLQALLPVLVRRGVRVATIKHAHHDFEIDVPGKDSFEHRAAGASEVVVSSARRYALIGELRGAPERSLAELLLLLGPADLILVEGFTTERHAKLEVVRAAAGGTPFFPHDPAVCALATDVATLPTALPRAALDDVDGVADLVLAHALALAATLARLAA